ncbi:hypothetical protein B6D60_09425 [candidate division KSB1 bacterium 4484_87]|nr:MAG: hypothetical protein B6D60_09425 [candidate division KSB1 bacterium 4484_87]
MASSAKRLTLKNWKNIGGDFQNVKIKSPPFHHQPHRKKIIFYPQSDATHFFSEESFLHLV